MKNTIYTIFALQILSSKLLLVATSAQKSKISILVQIKTNNNLSLMICYESVIKML